MQTVFALLVMWAGGLLPYLSAFLLGILWTLASAVTLIISFSALRVLELEESYSNTFPNILSPSPHAQSP